MTQHQDWLYDEGEDATKAVYVAKMDEIRFVAGPIVQRYLDKLEEERAARQKAEEERQAKVRAEQEAKRKQEEEAKKAAEAEKKEKEGTKEGEQKESKDTEMADAEGKGPEVENVD